MIWPKSHYPEINAFSVFHAQIQDDFQNGEKIGKFYSNLNFYKFIYHTQWTIANPVDAVQPAKRHKKAILCFDRQDQSSTVHSPGGASYFLPV